MVTERNVKVEFLAREHIPRDAQFRAAIVFLAAPLQVAEKLQPRKYADDLDHFEAAYFHAANVPMMIQRYDGNPSGEYTLLYDASRASALPQEPCAFAVRLIKQWLELQDDAIVWREDKGNVVLEKPPLSDVPKKLSDARINPLIEEGFLAANRSDRLKPELRRADDESEKTKEVVAPHANLQVH